MAKKTRAQLVAEAEQIRDEVVNFANTAVRVGGHMLNKVDSSPVAYSDSGVPATTPERLDLYIDTDNENVYIGVDNVDATDWDRLAKYSDIPSTSTFVQKSLFEANSILAAELDNDPQPLELAEDTIVGRITGGNVDALTPTEVRTMINVEDGADVTDATNVAAAGATMNTDTDISSNGYFLDEDDMSSDDATKVPSQQSVKAYVDSKVNLSRYVQLTTGNWNVDLEVATDVNFFVCPVDLTITEVAADGGVAPTGASLIFDLNDGKSGSSILGDKIEVEATETSSRTAATQPTIVTASFSAGDQIWIDVDQIGSTVAGQDFQITIYYDEDETITT